MEIKSPCSCHHACTCPTDVHPGFAECPVCKKMVCPVCGSCDVVVVSRVTGYLQDVAGWNNGKRQELRDRHRHDVK